MRYLLTPLAAAALLSAQVVHLPELYFTSGRVLARGSNKTSEGHHKLRSYRIEEVRLAKSTEAEIAGKKQAVSRAFRVIITGEHFPVRATPPMVWVAGKLIGSGQESSKQDEIIAVTFDAALIPEGAAIAFSFGEDEPRETLREKIQYTIRP